jgi:hypothetical protein
MAAARLLLVLLCTLAVQRGGLAHGNLLTIAAKQVGVMEKTGHNDGPAVERYLDYVHLPKGEPWCAAFISWVFGQAGYARPRSGWSPDLLPAARRVTLPFPGAVLGIYFPEHKRIAHVGLVISSRHDWVESIEGNTNLDGSREGNGVYRKLRHKRFIYGYADWTGEKPKVILHNN